jgi:hypothetical protein
VSTQISYARFRALSSFPKPLMVNVLIFFRPMQAPTGGSIGTTVNHIGFSAPDLKPFVAKIKANGYKMITAESVTAKKEASWQSERSLADNETIGVRKGKARRGALVHRTRRVSASALHSAVARFLDSLLRRE